MLHTRLKELPQQKHVAPERTLRKIVMNQAHVMKKHLPFVFDRNQLTGSLRRSGIFKEFSN